MEVEYVVVYLETMNADNENTSVAEIQKNFENIEADYDHVVTEKTMCAFESEAVHGVFKKTRTSRRT